MKKFAILIAAIALVCFSAPAMAVDWNFYGSARMATFWVSEDFGDGENLAGTDDSDQDLQWDFQVNSRVGATVKAENINGRFEFGVSDDNVTSRRLFGEWKFGFGSLKVGKDYTPFAQFISGQVGDTDFGLLGLGAQYGARRGQVAFKFGKFEIALINPSSSLLRGLSTTVTTFTTVPGLPGQPDINVPTATTTDVNGDIDEILPKLEVGFGMGFDTWYFNLIGGAQYYCIEDVESADNPGQEDDLSVVSWALGGDIGFNFGPGYLKGAFSYGQNIGNAGWGNPGGGDYIGTRWQGGFASWDGDDDTNDTYTAMGAIVGGLKVSDMLSFEAGFGMRNDRTDEGVEKDGTPWNAYIQSVIALAPGVYIVPEFGYYDADNSPDGEEAGSVWYLGGKWQVDF